LFDYYAGRESDINLFQQIRDTLPSPITKRRLAAAAIAFGVLAICAGVLQAWAFAVSRQPMHAVLAAFALSVGTCVVSAGAVALLTR